MSKEKCVEIIKGIYNNGEDVELPHRQGVEPITMLASGDGFKMQAAYEPKSYKNAEEVFDALLAVEALHEDDPLTSLLEDLKYVV